VCHERSLGGTQPSSAKSCDGVANVAEGVANVAEGAANVVEEVGTESDWVFGEDTNTIMPATKAIAPRAVPMIRAGRKLELDSLVDSLIVL